MSQPTIYESAVPFVLRFTEALARKMVVIGLLAVILIVVADVMVRNLLGTGIPGSVEINEYLLVIIGFMGIVMTNGLKGHITVDLLYEVLPPLGKVIFDYIGNILVFVLVSLFLYASWAKAAAESASGETSWFGAYVVPVWMFRWIVPISCLLLLIQVGISILDDIRKPGTGV
jgi:TRAP-type C4-dicarboxylate transport system permease small subunit